MADSSIRNNPIPVTLTEASPIQDVSTTQDTLQNTVSHDHGGLPLEILTPAILVAALMIGIFVCIRYKIAKLNYKNLFKVLRPGSPGQDSDEEEVMNEAAFSPPPEYDNAVNMPTPVRDSHSVEDECNKTINKVSSLDVFISTFHDNDGEVRSEEYLILEHVQKMVKDVQWPIDCLPSYVQYVQAFPNVLHQTNYHEETSTNFDGHF